MKQALLTLSLIVIGSAAMASTQEFKGSYVEGSGDKDLLQAVDRAYEMIQPSSNMTCLPMLYRREWDGLVEGPTWDAWWIQNSFGPSFTMMPFLTEPYQTWITHSQALWFMQMGDGKKVDRNGYVAPIGCLCDAATPTFAYYRQGDGNVPIHDWCIGFTTAGLLLQSELMLIKRNPDEIKEYLPQLETVAAFLDSRRDPKNNLLLGGVASNLLAPSYGGWLQPDGKREKAYLAELSVNYVAALDRLIEVCKLAKELSKAKKYGSIRSKVKKALSLLLTPEGYFIQALNPDGTKQGVFGAKKAGYFEAAPNHDAMCFRVVNDKQAKTIYERIKAIPQLRPHSLILPNYPSYDTMYENDGLFQYGIWVNGGHWTTAEARMMMGYARVGAWTDALSAFDRLYDLAVSFRSDNPLTGQGSTLYQPSIPYNVVYDNWGAAGGTLRGWLGYEYNSDGIILRMQLPSSISRYVQKFPVCFGKRKVYISVAGQGAVSQVVVDGKPVSIPKANEVLLKLSPSEGISKVQIGRGGAAIIDAIEPTRVVRASSSSDVVVAKMPIESIAAFYNELRRSHLETTYEAQLARVIVEMMNARHDRRRRSPQNEVPKSIMPGVPLANGSEVDKLYIETIEKLIGGLQDNLSRSSDKRIRDIAKKVNLM